MKRRRRGGRGAALEALLLPDPAEPDPLMHLLLENPWPGAIAMAVLAAGLFWGAGQVRSFGLLFGAAGAILIALAWPVVALLVETPRELGIALTRRLVHATAPPDPQTISRLLSGNATLHGPNGRRWATPARLHAAVGAIPRGQQVARHWITQVEAERTAPDRIIAFVAVTSFRDASAPYGGEVVRSNWRIRWQETAPGRWRAMQLQWLELNHRPPTQGLVP